MRISVDCKTSYLSAALMKAVYHWPSVAGDVVICVRPVAPEENVIKRVTAVESEFVVLYPDRDHADVRRVQVRRIFVVVPLGCRPSRSSHHASSEE